MRYIEPHAHMVSRTTDDYVALATAGCQAVCEPAFWAGFDRGSVNGFFDYFRQLTEFEPQRAAKYGLAHYCWLCLNPKEAEDLTLAGEVLDIIPQFLDRPNVLGIGEIGLNKNSRNELEVFQRHVDLAARHEQLILIHTPHLEDKLKGTKLIVDSFEGRFPRQPGPCHHRSRRGAHRRTGAGRRLLGGNDSLPRIQMHGGAGRGHDRTIREPAALDEQRLRLGRERAAGRAARGIGNAAARPRRGADRLADFREPGAIPRPVKEIPRPV